MARVYVAGKFENKENVRAVMELLVINGHTITHDWTHEDPAGLEGVELAKYLRGCAEKDLAGVLKADVLVVLPEDPGTGRPTVGRWLEVGAALASDVPVVIVGDSPLGVFSHLVITTPTVRSAIEFVNAGDAARVW